MRARAASINGYSAHADRNGLLDWTKPIARGLRHTFVVHGDPEPAAALAEGLRQLGAPDVAVPGQGDAFSV